MPNNKSPGDEGSKRTHSCSQHQTEWHRSLKDPFYFLLYLTSLRWPLLWLRIPENSFVWLCNVQKWSYALYIFCCYSWLGLLSITLVSFIHVEGGSCRFPFSLLYGTPCVNITVIHPSYCWGHCGSLQFGPLGSVLPWTFLSIFLGYLTQDRDCRYTLAI